MLIVKTVRRRRMVAATAFSLVFVILSLQCAEVMAQTVDDCSNKLKEAQAKYEAADFDGSIALINQCMILSSVTSQQKAKAYELLGLNYTGKGIMEKVRDYLRQLLAARPDYKPTPLEDFPIPFLSLLEEVRKEIPAEKPKTTAQQPSQPQTQPEESGGFPQTWHFIAGGAVVAGILVLVLNKKETTSPAEQSLPTPPVRP